jgi:hypothetical protein
MQTYSNLVEHAERSCGATFVDKALDVDNDPQVLAVEERIRELAREWESIRHYLKEAGSMKFGFAMHYEEVKADLDTLGDRKHKMMLADTAQWKAAGEPDEWDDGGYESLDDKVRELENELEQFEGAEKSYDPRD